MDEELLRYLEFLLWHRRTCGAKGICKTCDSANGLRDQIMQQIFSTVIYTEQMIGVKQRSHLR